MAFKKIKELIAELMERYADAVEGVCIGIGECAEIICAGIVRCGKYLLGGFVVVLLYLLLAVAMSVWYLPYRYLIKSRRERRRNRIDKGNSGRI